MKSPKAMVKYDFGIGRKQGGKKLTIRQRYARVIEMCTDYLEKKLTIENCMEMILFANRHRMKRLTQTAATFIDVNFEKVFTSDEFLELSIDQLNILTTLLVYNEMTGDDLDNAVLLWSKYQRKMSKRKHISRPNYMMHKTIKTEKDCMNSSEDTGAKATSDEILGISDGTSDERMPSPPPPPSISSQQ